MNDAFNDPKYTDCAPDTTNCKKSWGLRVVGSSDIHIYGAGLYSFFDNYLKNCSSDTPQYCQENIVSVEKSLRVSLLNLNTVGAVYMVNVDSIPVAEAEDNANAFGATVMRFDIV